MWNNDSSDIHDIRIDTTEIVYHTAFIGDVENNGYNDIVFISHYGGYWCVLYNQGITIFNATLDSYSCRFPDVGFCCKDVNGDAGQMSSVETV